MAARFFHCFIGICEGMLERRACAGQTSGHFRRPRQLYLVHPSDTNTNTNTIVAKRDPVSLLKQKFVKLFARLTSFPPAEQAVSPSLNRSTRDASLEASHALLYRTQGGRGWTPP